MQDKDKAESRAWFLSQFTPPLTAEELIRLTTSTSLIKDSVELMTLRGYPASGAIILISKKILGRK